LCSSVAEAGGLPLPDRPDLFGDIPDYPGFYGVAELSGNTARQAAASGVELLCLGETPGGRRLEAVRIGRGRPVVLAYGFPHANEPGGGVTLDYLVERLAADPELVRCIGCTWYIIKCLDPDAARRNEGWFRGPFTPLNYALHYYRQPATRQVEWGFPIEHGTLRLTEPIPEVRAVQALVDDIRPQLLFSLHNSNLGGVYYWVTESWPELYPRLRRATAAVDLPLHLGEPEHMVARPLAPGIYYWASARAIYDYFAANFAGDAAPVAGTGASCEEYARETAGTAALSIETPLFCASVITDTRPAGVTRRRAALEEIEATREFYSFMQEAYDGVSGYLEQGSQQASDQSFDRLLHTLDARRTHVERDRGFDREATRAELADRLHLRRLNRMLPLGMFIRVLEGRLRRLPTDGRATTRMRDAQRRLLQRLRTEAETLEAAVDYWASSPRQAVAQQLAAMLLTIDHWRGTEG